MSQPDLFKHSNKPSVPITYTDTNSHTNVKVPENNLDFEEYMKLTLEYFGPFVYNLLFSPTLDDYLTKPKQYQKIEAPANDLNAYVRDQSLRQYNYQIPGAESKSDGQEETGLVLPTSTGSSSQSDIYDNWYYPGCEDDALMKTLTSDLYKNLIVHKDASSYVDTLFPRLALPPEMLTTNEFLVDDDTQDQLCTDNFMFDADNMKMLQHQQDKLAELQQRRANTQYRKDELELELSAQGYENDSRVKEMCYIYLDMAKQHQRYWEQARYYQNTAKNDYTVDEEYIEKQFSQIQQQFEEKYAKIEKHIYDLSQVEMEDIQGYIAAQNKIKSQLLLQKQQTKELANLYLRLTEMRYAAGEALKWKTETQCGNYEAWLRVQLEQTKY